MQPRSLPEFIQSAIVGLAPGGRGVTLAPPRPRSLRRRVLIGFLLALAIPATAARLRVDDVVLAGELQRAGARLIADYGAFQWLDAPPELAARFAPHPRLSAPDAGSVIALHARTLDPTQPEMKTTGAAAPDYPGKRLRLVQFAGPVKPEWHAELQASGAAVVSYLPDNAFLVYADAAAARNVHGRANSSRHVQWEGEYRDEYKIHPEARPDEAQRKGGHAAADRFAIQMVADAVANARTLQVLERFALAPMAGPARLRQYVNVIVRVPPDRLAAIAAQPDVIFIEPFVVPELHDERQDQIVAGHLAGGGPSAPGYLEWLAGKGFTQEQFTASGFAVDVTDSGVDNGTLAPGHFGLYALGDTGAPSRIAYNHFEGSPYGDRGLAGCDGHGTLNAHIVAGYNDRPGFPFTDAAGYSFGLGVAPFVRVGSSVIFDPSFTYPDFSGLQARAYRDGARISANSWGSSAWGRYTMYSQIYDALVRDAQPDTAAVPAPGNQEMVIVFSAGNSGRDLSSIGAPGTAKNVLTVGATENAHPHALEFGGNQPDGEDGCALPDADADSADDIAFFSSRGPCFDARMKPDLVAPGTHVTGGVPQATPAGPLGTALDCFDGWSVCALPGAFESGASNLFFPLGQQFYTTSSGTSHSAPAVAGACALLRQYCLDRSLPPPSPAMSKAWLMNAARYVTGAEASDTLPSPNQGMGRLDLGAAFDSLPRLLRDQWAPDKFTATGQQRVFRGVVAEAGQPFRVTLAWTDAPGALCGAAWNNDLDLTVTIAGQTLRGNVFRGAFSIPGGEPDGRNNVESVFLPAGTTGAFLVTVTAANINSDGVPNDADPLDQDFALVVYNARAVEQPVLLGAGLALIAEGSVPLNGAADPGETVTVHLAVTNTFGTPTTNLQAALLPGAGVTAPTGPQAFGVLECGGPAVGRDFTFLASGSCGDTVTARLRLTDGDADLGVLSYALPLGVARTNVLSWTNSAPMVLEAGTSGPLSPDPSILHVSGMTNAVSTMTVTLADLWHSYPGDLDVLLCGPTGQGVMLVSDAGGGNGVAGVMLTLDDAASEAVSEDQLVSGVFRPANYDAYDLFGSTSTQYYPASLSALAGTNPNGEWQLHVYDDTYEDVGGIAGGWSLAFQTLSYECVGAPVPADLAASCWVAPTRVAPGTRLTCVLTATNRGLAVAANTRLIASIPPGLAIQSCAVSPGRCTETNGTVLGDFGDLAPAAGGQLVLELRAHDPGPCFIRAELVGDSYEADLTNNTLITRVDVERPQLAVSAEPVTEGDSGNETELQIRVCVDPPSPEAVSVAFTTIDGTAIAGADYHATNGLLVFRPMEECLMIPISVLGDALFELESESFRFRLADVTNALLPAVACTATILDDDPPVTLHVGDAEFTEGDAGRSVAFLSVALSEASAAPVSFAFHTRDGSARAGEDYVATQGVLTLPPGQTHTNLGIEIVGDTRPEPTEDFSIELSHAVGATFATNTARCVLLDPDPLPPRIIVTDQAVLAAESFTPANGAIEPGEVVTVQIALRNRGRMDTTNLIATLRASAGVVAPSGPQNYERLAAGGPAVRRPFTFTADPAGAVPIVATLDWADGPAEAGTVRIELPLGADAEFVLVDLATNDARTVVYPRTTWGEAETLAVATNALWVAGSGGTVQFAAADLSGATPLRPTYEVLVANLRTETVYSLGEDDTPYDFQSGRVNSLLELDRVTGELTGNRIRLSAPVSVPCGAGLFSGCDRVVVYSEDRAFQISLPWGTVTDLGQVVSLHHAFVARCAFQGVAEHFDGAVHLCYVADAQKIVRTRLPDGLTTTVARFADLGATAAFTVSPRRGRWYFHHAGRSEFRKPGYDEEVVGSAAASVRMGATNPPLILVQPADVVAVVGDTAGFTVVGSGATPLSSQWQKDGADLPGATAATLVLSHVQPADIGAYRVRLNNSQGTVLSSNAVLRTAAHDAVVGVFANSRSTASVKDSLEHRGFGVALFTNFAAATATYRHVVIPSIDYDLPASLARDERTALTHFVAQGGVLIVHGEYWNSFAAYFLNSFFGFQLEEWYPDSLSPRAPVAALNHESYYPRTPAAEGTEFADDPPRLSQNTYVNFLWSGSFPPGARSLYDEYGWSAVALFEWGDGLIVFLGWNWQDAVPLGCQDGGWLEVLASAATQSAPLAPAAPILHRQPLSQTAARGDAVTFNATHFSRLPVTWQWRRNGVDVPGATHATLTLLDLEPDDAGLYQLCVSNPAGSVLSSNALLTVVEVTRDLADDFDPELDPAQWSAFSGDVRATSYGGCVSGTRSLWFGGDDDRYACSRSLDTTTGGLITFALRFANKDAYPWRRSNSSECGVVLESSTDGGLTWARLAFYNPFEFRAWTPVSVVLPRAAQSPATLVRWRQNWHRGAWVDHWAIDDVAIAVQSPAVYFTLQPTNQNAVVGSTIRFKVDAAGVPPIGYHWFKDDSGIPEATNATLTLSNVQLADAGRYRAQAYNDTGSQDSLEAILTVAPVETFVWIFADPIYEATQMGDTYGVPSVLASLRSLSVPCGTFEDIRDAAAAAHHHRILIPSLCQRDLSLDITPDLRDALSNFVARGHALVLLASDLYLQQSDDLLNAVFGWTCEERYGWASAYPRTRQTAGTRFADGPESLPWTSRVLLTGSLPPGARSLYESGGESAVVLVPVGEGIVIYLGYNWNYAAPNGSEDDGWLSLLERAAGQAVPLPPMEPAIIRAPISRTVAAGMSVQLEAQVLGSAPLYWQWFKDGAVLAGASDPVLWIRQATTNDSGSYSLMASNAYGSTATDLARLNVLPLPLAEEFEITGVFASGSRMVSQGYVTEGDRSAIAASGTHVFSTGAGATRRYALADLSGGEALGQIADAFVSDLRTGTPYSLGDDFGPIDHGGTPVTALYERNGASGELTGAVVPLTLPIDLPADGWDTGLFAGFGRIVVHTGSRVFDVWVPSGLVIDLGEMPVPRHNLHSGNWAYWGVAEYFGGTLYLAHVWDPWTVVRTAVPTGEATVLANFDYLSDLASFTVSPAHGRWYFHYQWPNQFGAGSECIGYADATFRLGRGLPVILRQPSDTNVAVAGVAAFEVVAWSDTPLRCQWFKDGQPISGATNRQVTLPDAQLPDAGSYQVQLVNDSGAVSSAPARLTLLDPGGNFFDDFEPDLDALQWQSVSGTTGINPGAGAVSGRHALWFGNAGERQATTRALNTTGGGVLQFHLRFADGACDPWEQIDLPDEGIVLEWSTDAGGHWSGLATYDDPGAFAWTLQQIAVPTEAESPATQFRWRQADHSGPGCDHWALDDVTLITGPWPPLWLTAGFTPGGDLELVVRCLDGSALTPERAARIRLRGSVDLARPLEAWTPLIVMPLLTNGTLRLPLIPLSGFPHRFFRADEQP